MTIKELEKSLISPKGYKRFTNPYLRYAGGKSLAVGHVLNKMPESVSSVISPFFGGGSIELALSQFCDVEVKGFDIYEPLVLFWYNLINNNDNFTDELLKLEADKETYEKIRVIASDTENFNKLPDIKKAAYFYYNHNLSYGPGFPGWASSVYLDQSKWEKKIFKLKENRIKNVSIERKSFEDAIHKNSKEFMYLDPPYVLAGEMFKGIYPSRNRPFNHKGFKHELLAEILKSYKGKWILSYNDCDEVREMYKGFNFYFPTWQYTMGQGETRIGANRQEKNVSHIKKSHEILITNY